MALVWAVDENGNPVSIDVPNATAGDIAAIIASMATDAELAAHAATSHGSSLTIEDEGVSQGDVTTINFAGAGVTASVAAGEATVTISGGGGGSGDEPSAADWMGF